MPILKRIKTNYPGVFYIEGTSPITGKPEKIFYIRYRKAGKMIEEKAGWQSEDMTPARANDIRSERMRGKKPTQREARELREAEKQAQAALWTINRLWGEYTAHKEIKGLAQDRSRFEKYIRPLWGDKEPQEIQPLEVDRLRLRILKKKAPQTAKLILALLRRIVSFGVKRHLSGPLSFHLEMPKVNNLKTEDLTPDQLEALLEAMESDPNLQAANFMKMALFTGMRRGELFRLQWQDVDFDRGFIHIKDPKGGHDQKIPLNPAARELLLAHSRTGSPYIFPGRGGNRRTDINKQVNRIKKVALLPKDFRALHGLRHVYASMLASSGLVDLYTLQKLLTHKSAAMTQRYAHLRDEALRRASDLAGNLITEALNGRKSKIANLEE
jgi:integrase